MPRRGAMTTAHAWEAESRPGQGKHCPFSNPY